MESTKNGGGELDRVDRAIMSELQQNGRISVAELSRRVHLSTTPCLARMKRLEREGYIMDYVARLDARKLGYDLVAFVEVSLDRTNPDVFERFRAAIKDLSEVVECYMVAGNFDYLLKVRVVSMGEYRRFLAERLTAIAGLQNTHTYFTLDEVKVGEALPLVRASADRKARPRTRSKR